MRSLTPAGVLATAIAVVLVVFATGGGGSSIVARAYAATSSQGVIVHYAESTYEQYPRGWGNQAVDRTAEVWVSGSRRHTLLTSTAILRNGGRYRFRSEVAINHGDLTIYQAGGLLKAAQTCANLPIIAMLVYFDHPCADPLSVVRGLYRSGRLHGAGQAILDGRRVDVIEGDELPCARYGTIRVLVDPRTFVPLEVQTDIRGVRETTKFTDYQRLPLTPQNERLLAMRPHPHAPVSKSRLAGAKGPSCR